MTVVVALPATTACNETDAPSEATTPFPVPAHTKLSKRRFLVLSAAMDAMIPGDPSSPGATLAHAAFYLDQLLAAFDVDPPRIFAGGPYSGRHGGPDHFQDLTPLTRVEELRWRTFIQGSQGLPEREWNGPVVGLIERYEGWLDELDASARDETGTGYVELDLETRRALLQSADPELVKTLYEHTVEGTYGDPVYGGNHQFAGWLAIDYEGDRQPIGYTAAQMAHPEEN